MEEWNQTDKFWKQTYKRMKKLSKSKILVVEDGLRMMTSILVDSADPYNFRGRPQGFWFY
jgi:hypothetical protein